MAQTIVVNSRGEVAPFRLTKAPSDVQVLKVDFGLFFGTETASTLTVTPDGGLTVGTTSVAGNIATVPVSGGSDGGLYNLKVKLAGSTQTKEVVVQVAVRDPSTVILEDDYGLRTP